MAVKRPGRGAQHKISLDKTKEKEKEKKHICVSFTARLVCGCVVIDRVGMAVKWPGIGAWHRIGHNKKKQKEKRK